MHLQQLQSCSSLHWAGLRIWEVQRDLKITLNFPSPLQFLYFGNTDPKFTEANRNLCTDRKGLVETQDFQLSLNQWGLRVLSILQLALSSLPDGSDAPLHFTVQASAWFLSSH